VITRVRAALSGDNVTPNFSGTWKANLEKSKLLGSAPRETVAKIEHADPELVEEIVTTKADGTEDRVFFRCLTTGEEVTNSVHGAQLRSRSHWTQEVLLIESWISVGGRNCHFRDHWSLSPDGQILTMDYRAHDLAGQMTVLEKILTGPRQSLKIWTSGSDYVLKTKRAAGRPPITPVTLAVTRLFVGTGVRS
jgi:hypothetical protein